MIKFATEAPLGYLPHLSRLTDLDFVNAARLLNEAQCVEHYRETKSQGRELIVNGGTRGLEETVTVKRLIEAADLVNADYVITPNGPEHAGTTELDELWHLAKWKPYNFGYVLHGDTPTERFARIQRANGLVKLWCLPANRWRIHTFLENMAFFTQHAVRLHLMRCDDLYELKTFALLSEHRKVPPGGNRTAWSFDSYRAVQATLDRHRVQDAFTARTHMPNVCDTSSEALELLRDNVNYMRKVARM